MIWAAIGAMVLGCSSSSSRKGDPERAAQVARCAQGLQEAMGKRGSAQLATLVAACPQACPGLAPAASLPSPDIERAGQVVARCGGFCNDAAERAFRAAAPEQAYATLTRVCGPETYGLPEERAPLMSDTWLVLVRVHQWLQENLGHAEPATRAQLERAGAYTHITLPLPARFEPLYTLPEARFRRPVRELFYVVAGAGDGPDDDHSVRAAALPIARLLPDELEQRPLPGGYFPGQPVAPGGQEYRERFRVFAELHPERMRASLDPTPLVFIDAGAPVSELVRAMSDIDITRFSLAVSGPTAAAHPITLERLIGSSAAPVLSMGADQVTLLGAAKEITLPRDQAARAQLEAELADLSVAFAPLDKIEVVLAPGADMSALVEALDLIAASKFATALVRSP